MAWRVTGRFAPTAQRPARADPLTAALAEAIGEPVVTPLSEAEAIAESQALVDEADRGEYMPWALSRSIALAAQFPGCERLQLNVGTLMGIGGDEAAALGCWREMLGRFPTSPAIFAAYAASLRKCLGAQTGRAVVDGYLGARAADGGVTHALRAARGYAALGDVGDAVRLLEQWQGDDTDDALVAAELARLREQDRPASIAALETLLERAIELRAARPPGRASGPVALIGGTLGGGGAERQLVNTALGLQERYREGTARFGPVTVYCRKLDARRANDFYLPRLEEAGIRVADYLRAEPWGGDRRSSRLAPHAGLIDRLPHRMREGAIQLTDLLRHDAPAVVQIWQDGMIFAAGLAALLAGVPRIVLNVRTMPPSTRSDRRKPEQEALYRGLLRAPGVSLVANSAAAARGYEAWLDLAAGSVPVVPNGVGRLPAAGSATDRALWQAFDARTGSGFVLGGVMRFDDNKRPLDWLAIAAALAERLPDARFVLAGAGPLRATAEDFARRRGIADRLLLVGRTAQVGYWLEKFDALALTSLHEGLPNVLIEAQLAGVPVISTPAGGAPEAVAPSPANLLLESAETVDCQAAAAHLAALARRPSDQFRSEAEAVRGWAHTRFSADAMIDRTLEIFGG